MSASNYLTIKSPEKTFRIIVEGNIASGKSFFLQQFINKDNYAVYNEPIEEWQNCNGKNFLKLVYSDPKQWAFAFQSLVQLTMVKRHLASTEKQFKLMERSIFSARKCFIENQYNNGNINNACLAVLDEWYNWYKTDCEIDLIIYLRTNPEVAYERALKRNRAEEKEIPLVLFQQLHILHEKWLIKEGNFNDVDKCKTNWEKEKVPIYVIDGNLDKNEIKKTCEKLSNSILDFHRVLKQFIMK
jgi:deoxyadenosine/deoxycytidine kinase